MDGRSGLPGLKTTVAYKNRDRGRKRDSCYYYYFSCKQATSFALPIQIGVVTLTAIKCNNRE